MDRIDEFVERYRLTSEEWARLDGEARRLEEMRKPVLGELVNQADGPVARAEHAAYASEHYRRHVEAMVKARTTANIARAEKDAAEMRFEAWRTANATKRAQMRIT